MTIQLPSKLDVERALELWTAADVRLRQLLDRYGNAAPALRHFGLILWEGGDPQNAAQALVGAVALDPGDVRCWNDLGGAFEASGRGPEASACFRESLARDEFQAPTWRRLGLLQAALGDRLSAEQAYRRSLAIDEASADAWFGLGLLLYDAKRYGDAVRPLERAIALGRGNDATAHHCLGQARDALGDFEGADEALSEACRLDPGSLEYRKRQIRPRFVLDVIQGSIDDACQRCGVAGLDQPEIEKIASEAFHVLSAYGFNDAAIRLGEWCLARRADDAMQAYLLGALKGESRARAPDDYIVHYFDRFADEFDDKLVGVLRYRAPGQLARLVAATGRTIGDVLDLGCGTGLAGAALAGTVAGVRLTGVDLSPRMLDKARERGCYDRLVECEALAYLEAQAEQVKAAQAKAAPFDLVLSADVLVYFGDLAPLVAAVSRVLRPGALWALTIETSETNDIRSLPSGRFAHNLDYLRRVSVAAGFEIIAAVPTTIRLEAGRPARGMLVVLAVGRIDA